MTRRGSATAALLAAVCALLAGCGDQTGPDLAEPAASATTSTETDGAATLPKSYTFTLTSSCGERGLIGDYRVTVRDELVTGAKSLNKDYPYQPTLTEVPTLQDLVALAKSAQPDAVVEYVVDDTGLPRSLSLDPVPNGIDDEECYEVTDLVTVAMAHSGVKSPIVASIDAFSEAKGVERINFEPYTPTRLASESSIAIYGIVKSVEDGRVYGSGDIAMKNVVIGIDPTDVIKDDPARTGDLVYVELSRVDDDSSLDKIADALPVGTHVALFGWPADDPGFEVNGDPNAGREDGSSVYSPLAQGLWFETPDGLANVLTPSETSSGVWAGVDSWTALKDVTTP